MPWANPWQGEGAVECVGVERMGVLSMLGNQKQLLAAVAAAM